MSDLSPQSGPKRTLIRSLSPIAILCCSFDQVRVDDPADGHPYIGHSFDDLRVGAGRQAESAIFWGNDAAEQPHLLHFLDDVGRINVVVLQGSDMRLYLRLQELIYHLEDQPFVLGGLRSLNNRVHQGVSRQLVAHSASAKERAFSRSKSRTASRMCSAALRGTARSALSKNFATTSPLLNGRSAQPRLTPSRCRNVRPSSVSTTTSPV